MNSIAVIFDSIFENDIFYVNMAYRQPYLIPPRYSLEKPAFGGSLRNKVEGSILSAHARDLQQKRPGAHHCLVCSGPL